MLPVPSERYVPVVESALDEDLDPHPCKEDEEFFKSRPDAEEMGQAISKFLYVCTSIYWYVLVHTSISLSLEALLSGRQCPGTRQYRPFLKCHAIVHTA